MPIFTLILLFCNSFDIFCIFACVINHVRECSSFQYQFIRLSNLQHSASVHDDDFVVICNGVESMSNSDDRVVFKLGFQDSLNQLISPHVDIGGGFVQHQELVVLPQQCSSQTQQLFLTD